MFSQVFGDILLEHFIFLHISLEYKIDFNLQTYIPGLKALAEALYQCGEFEQSLRYYEKVEMGDNLPQILRLLFGRT